MRKTTLILILTAMWFSGYAQKDWFGFNRYKADNDSIIASGKFPDVVFMGNSITDNWAYFHPEFFSENNFCGRGIGGQTSAQMLVRFTADVMWVVAPQQPLRQGTPKELVEQGIIDEYFKPIVAKDEFFWMK